MTGDEDGGTDAPVPAGVAPRMTLASRLFESGMRFIHAALAAYTDDDREVFALHAGVGIEHLMKARLAAINPMLILDWSKRASVPTLLWLADESKHDQPVPKGLRTIGAAEAYALLRTRASIESYDEALALLREHRNGISHVGEADLDELVALMPQIIRAVVELAEGLAPDPAYAIFGPHQEYAELQLSEWESDDDRDYLALFAQARQRFTGRYPNWSRAMRDALRESITTGFHRNRSTFDQQLADCPCCDLPAYLDGELTLHSNHEYAPDGALLRHEPLGGEYRAVRLGCPTCGLVLDRELIDRSGALEN